VPITNPRLVLAADADVALVPPFAIGKVPVTPEVIGKPVQLVRTPADGVPRAGVTNVGEVIVGDVVSAFVATAIAMLAN
jgi:hypothetical protein